MKTAKQCYPCMQRLVNQVAELSTSDEQLKAEVIKKGLKTLEQNFSLDRIAPTITAKVLRDMGKVTHVTDPYLKVKEREIVIARELCQQLNSEEMDDFQSCLKLAAKGNTLDFFKSLDMVKEELRKEIDFTIDDSNKFLMKLKSAGKILYLADNMGEVFLELPLVSFINQLAEVTYVVKPSPVLNDVTLEDLNRIGIREKFSKVITTGTATPGVDLTAASTEFKSEFDSADLVFAKGMGHYECLSNLPPEGRFFHCLMAKCQPVADSLGVPLHSYVALLR